MRKRSPIWFFVLLCAAATGLASCEGMSEGPFRDMFGATEKPAASCGPTSDGSRMTRLEKENAKLKKRLAETMQDNATLRDLAAKKW
jgi:hypothetical protein